jgi:hypothetical protein
VHSHRFLSRWLIRPVLHWLIRHQRYPKYDWYDRMFRREFVRYDERDEQGWVEIGANVSPEAVAAFRRWWNQREAK